MVSDGSASDLTKTNNWVSTLNATPVPLMDVFAKNRFQNYARTIHRLKAKILYDGYIKPFAIITDDNLVVSDPAAADYGDVIRLIVQNYTWDLAMGTFDIDAQEYTDEDLGFDLSQDTGGGSATLEAPIFDDIVQNGGDVDVSWHMIVPAGETGYILQRQPYYQSPLLWINSWKTVYEGPLTAFTDSFDSEYSPMPASIQVIYRVAAKTDLLYGPYCAEQNILWVSP
jgi:hypothetical protein